ncbi:MAG: hypothetical protein ABSA33_06185 [Candidatus Micrarchaeaceae archaeon]
MSTPITISPVSTISTTAETVSQNPLVLSELTADVSDFVGQFQDYLQTNPTWIGNLTTQTSQTTQNKNN